MYIDEIKKKLLKKVKNIIMKTERPFANCLLLIRFEKFRCPNK